MTNLHNFAFKIETIWAQRVIKLILETKNTKTMLVSMCMAYSLQDKKLKTDTIYKNSKCTIFTIKN